VFLVCYSIARPESLVWAQALAQSAQAICPKAYFVIAGCKSDLRATIQSLKNENGKFLFFMNSSFFKT
jgi:hypothetical protein